MGRSNESGIETHSAWSSTILRAIPLTHYFEGNPPQKAILRRSERLAGRLEHDADFYPR